MEYSSETAKEILRLGGNLSVDQTKYTGDTLKELARLAKQHKAHLTVRITGYLSDTLKEVVRIAGKNATISV